VAAPSVMVAVGQPVAAAAAPLATSVMGPKALMLPSQTAAVAMAVAEETVLVDKKPLAAQMVG
jgi:hypothetical protein